ncbi:aaa-family atpase [Holotrichia oblita]|uniref:Aaa-family atpase n=1 Tax=Holotrichia oblita TaxID=644536 RepID=A0ACB9T9D7_HOLOL|nr:aaa-family atpase [Holotrichia oblita]
MPPKTKKSVGLWVHCDKCSCSIMQKDIELHENDCPPDTKKHSYDFIKGETLYGTVGIKNNEDIKGLAQNEIDNLVFLSQSVIQLCSLSIGNWAEIKSDHLSAPVAKTVWPTTEKTITSVLFTQNCLALFPLKADSVVTVTNVKSNIRNASLITLVLLDNRKYMELTTELHTRIHKLYHSRILAVGNKIEITFFGKVLKFEIKEIQCAKSESRELVNEFCELTIYDEDFFKVTNTTKFILFGNEIEYEKSQSKDLFKDIGGLDEEIIEIKELMQAVLGKSDKKINIKPSRGCLLYGNSGTGKTMLANALANSSPFFKISICATDLYTIYSGNSEFALKDLFSDAVDNAPSIVILDEFDILCPSRSNKITELEKRAVSNVLMFFEELNKKHSKVFVLGITNKIYNVDPAFRRSGRFDREIEIPTPNPRSRFDILKKIMKDVIKDEDNETLKEIAYAAHGFVGADLVALFSRAALHTSKSNRFHIEIDDWKFALTKVRPSAMREVQVEVTDVKWSDIGGQEKLKLRLKQAVEWPLTHPESFKRMGITPPRGVLMYGPPGCSKTMVAKALATESGLNFLSIKGPELFSKWVGESERAVRDVFKKARQVAPSIIFFDEIDALGSERSSGSSTSVQERVLAQLLTEMDGVSPLGDVIVLAATNRPDRIDKALIRPGRLDRLVYVPLPDLQTRKEIFKLKFAKMPIGDDVNIEKLASLTKGYSGAEVNAVCHEAAMAALEESLSANVVKLTHFEVALSLITPRTSENLIKLYEEYANKK